MDDQRTEHTSLRKIKVECKTCQVSESYYSDLSVKHFKMKHAGHEIVGGADKPAPRAVRAEVREPEEDAPVAGSTIKLPRVLVDLAVLPALEDPVFRIRGFNESHDEVFVITLPYYGGAKLHDMVEGGRHVDDSASDVTYTWEPTAVEYDERARERLGLLPEQAEIPGHATDEFPSMEAPAQVQVEVPNPEQPDTVAPVLTEVGEISLEHPEIVEPALQEQSPVALERPEMAEPAPIVESPPAVEEPAPAVEPPQVQVEAEKPKSARKPKAERKVEMVVAVPREPRPEDHLLVSKSWYVQGGSENVSEAIRVSEVLRAFRWKVEPVYTIGVMFEDILSIESTKNEFSRKLIVALEDAGYKFTAVTMEQGKVSAWFKKTEGEEPSTDAVQAAAEGDGPAVEQPSGQV